jgi:hypothetical protein
MHNKREVVIDYLYLDLNVCDRCVGTDKVLDEVLQTLTPALRLAGYEVARNRIEMATLELATQYRFVSSPTIRVNGRDIFLSVEENDCGCCSDISGTNVECRIFRYGDKSFEIPPKEMIADAILQTVFANTADEEADDYIMPENLKSFYQSKSEKGEFAMKQMSIYEPAMCCSTGLCGVGVDPELLRISTVLNTLQKNGIAVQRYNLSSAPQEFINNKAINEFINRGGADELPAVVVDGEIVITGRYPTNEEFTKLLGIPAGILGEQPKAVKVTVKKSGGCGCSGGNCC